jgi:hypothetical protein
MKPIRYQNEYLCTRCGNVWQSFAADSPNDRCPVCGKDEAPGLSTKMLVLLEMGSAIEASESRVLTGVVAWVEAVLIDNIKKYLDRVNPVEFDTEAQLQFRAQQFRQLKQLDDQVWIVTEDVLGVFNDSAIDDTAMVSVYDLLWIQKEIERQQEGQ